MSRSLKAKLDYLPSSTLGIDTKALNRAHTSGKTWSAISTSFFIEKCSEWQIKRREENNNHEDSKSIIFPPVNLIFVGCKYDLFEKYETENRKWLSKALRYLAHTYNASLAFSSSKNPQLITQLRAFFLEVMFEERPKVVAQRDHLKPIFVYRNQDSLTNIAVPASGSVSGI